NTKPSERFAQLDQQVSAEDFYKNPNRDTILSEHRKLRIIVEACEIGIKTNADSAELIEMFKDNEQELSAIKGEIAALCKQITKLKLQLLLSGDEDSNNCYLSINAGA